MSKAEVLQMCHVSHLLQTCHVSHLLQTCHMSHILQRFNVTCETALQHHPVLCIGVYGCNARCLYSRGLRL